MTRLWSGAALAMLAVAVVWWAPPLVFVGVAALLLVLACEEYARLIVPHGAPIPFALWCAAAALAGSAVVVPGVSLSHVVSLLLATVVICGSVAVLRWRGGDALSGVSAAVFAPLYLGFPIGALVRVREEQGPAGLFLLMLTVMLSDTAQYYTGRAFGQRPLAPAISPKKTVEGAVGGLVVGSLVFALAGGWWLDRPWPLSIRLALGATIVAAGILGDLFESMLKRHAGVKDSGSLIPGHGGVLDRIDALLFATPVYFIALTLL
mgnify:FL=1